MVMQILNRLPFRHEVVMPKTSILDDYIKVTELLAIPEYRRHGYGFSNLHQFLYVRWYLLPTIAPIGMNLYLGTVWVRA